jgi:hypothetical protein
MKVLSVAVALIGILAFAQADEVRSQIEASNKAISSMMLKKDLPGLEKAMKAGLTKNFVYIENGKSQNFTQMFENMKMGISSMKKITVASTKILSLKQKGNVVTCSMSHTMGGTMDGPDKKEHTSVFSGVADETYVKEGGKWKMSKMVWKSTKMTMDGKPMGAPGK